jgi:hypothetical protein
VKDNKHIQSFNEHGEKLNISADVSESLDKHRIGLIELYEDQIQDAGPFMTIVLEEAVRKLKETQLEPKKIEDWVVRLEKSWMTI